MVVVSDVSGFLIWWFLMLGVRHLAVGHVGGYVGSRVYSRVGVV